MDNFAPSGARRTLAGAEFVEGAACGVAQVLNPRSGAENFPAGGAKHLGVGAAEGAAQVRGGGSLRAQARGQDRPADRCQIQAEIRERGADGGADHQSHRTESPCPELPCTGLRCTEVLGAGFGPSGAAGVAPVLRCCGLHDASGDGISTAGVLDGGALRVGGECEHEHAAPGLRREVQGRPQ